MPKHYIHTQFKARYFSHGEFSDETKNIWVVLHGYGQLAEFFIQKFSILNPVDHFIVAPEGLSRYYRSGYSGRVGASWMTREERSVDIENYIRYLEVVRKQAIPSRSGMAKINILGFSQGVATLCRWATQGDFHFDRIIMWAGVIPPDLNFQDGQERLSQKDAYIVYGKNDQFMNLEGVKQQNDLISQLNITPVRITFDGDHDIPEEPLLQLATSFG